MILEEIAQQAMDYLDSVAVAAEYDINDMVLTVSTDKFKFSATFGSNHEQIMPDIYFYYPQKSPAI